MAESTSAPQGAPDPDVMSLSDYRVGQDNVRRFGLDVHNPVFAIAAVMVVVFVVFTLSFPEQAADRFGALRPWLTTRFDWVFMASANIFVLVCVGIVLSPWGSIRLGGADAKPDFSRLSWFAMLFAAGMGIGVMFYGVLEPLNHFMAPPFGPESIDSPDRRELAMAGTMLHWALHPWAIYAVVGLALAFFSFNRGLPLSIRSAFYPLLGERVWGWSGHVIDILAVFATLFGLAASLGYGAEQSSAGIAYLFNLPDGPVTQLLVIGFITLVALVSVLRGIDGGVKRLSEINIAAAALLFLFVLSAGPTLDILTRVASNTVGYVKHLPALSVWVGRDDGYYMHDWTTFYWSWWIAWSPFVGMFIARVSRGRTVREFLVCSLLIPSFVCIAWMTVFGGSAIDQYVVDGYQGVASTINNWAPELAMFRFLEQLPLTGLTSLVAIGLVMVFFITSMDSGSLVIDTITAGGKIDTPVGQRVFWCIVSGLIAAALLLGGGLGSLQALTLAAGFPFCLVLLVMCYSTIKGLHQ
ncbi:MAG: BCCT family transporter, partial [Pseudomonadales bacterium]